MENENFKKVGRRFGNTKDLPEELISQIQFLKKDELSSQIIEVIDDLYDGMANIDEILVGLFRKFEIILKRAFLTNKLYRMITDNILISVKGKKGIYTTRKELEEFYTSE